MTLNRRDFVKRSSLALAFSLGGSRVLLTPAEAREQALAFETLSGKEVEILEAIAEIILPGAKQAGVAHFVDQQLGVNPDDSMLALKYFSFPPPYANFYRAVLGQIENLAQTMFGKTVATLDEEQGKQLVLGFRDENPDGWQGPPSLLAYLAIRNDATDVFYGTPEGFKKLGIPYMEHILPPEGWS